MTSKEIGILLQPFEVALTPALLDRLVVYLELLLRWNERTNLSAIRKPEEIVSRHFGESLFAAKHLPEGATLLDFGSGAGFPGLPIQLARPELAVTLAESQGKKAAFLQEAVRVLGLFTVVCSGRAEQRLAGRSFDLVTLRAVDRPERARAEAWKLVDQGGWLCELAALDHREGWDRVIGIPGSSSSALLLKCRNHV